MVSRTARLTATTHPFAQRWFDAFARDSPLLLRSGKDKLGARRRQFAITNVNSRKVVSKQTHNRQIHGLRYNIRHDVTILPGHRRKKLGAAKLAQTGPRQWVSTVGLVDPKWPNS